MNLLFDNKIELKNISARKNRTIKVVKKKRFMIFPLRLTKTPELQLLEAPAQGKRQPQISLPFYMNRLLVGFILTG